METQLLINKLSMVKDIIKQPNSDIEWGINRINSIIADLKRELIQPDAIQSLPLSELGAFVDWIMDIKFKKYREGWCQEGGSNGWHCSTDELMKMFKEMGDAAQTLKLEQMNVEELKDEIRRKQALHIADVMRCLKSDPCAADYEKNYKETEQYLWELIEKNGSVLGGLISAMEKHLEN